jgi:hypothetical protein
MLGRLPVRRVLLVAIAALGLCTGVPLAAEPRLQAGVSADPMKLDGLLDEPAWQAAQIVRLTQQSPKPGEATPFETTVRIVVVASRLYFGFDCLDPNPQLAAAHTMQRDGAAEGDDTVSIVLDTYGDRRTGYLFQVNRGGARIDGLISGREEMSLDWDGVWDARVARTAQGWSAEIEIPAATLSFRKGLPQWGMNLERFVARSRTTLRWAAPELDAFLYDFARAGALVFSEPLNQGLGLEVSPFTAGKMQTDFRPADRSWLGQSGLDVTWRLTPELSAVFTLNTDFAETEVDSQQLNLTRFPLFFPEKRPFFLEGANQFGFSFALEDQFIPFFSRNIGLFGSDRIPIDEGLKIFGRLGRWSIGLLDVETRDTMGQSTGVFVPRTNLFAGRVAYDVTSHLRLGSILTHGNPDGRTRNTLAGFDGSWRTSTLFGHRNFQVSGWTAFSRGDGPKGNRTGWGYIIDYPNDLLDCFTALNGLGDALTAGLGFLPRPGVRRLDAACSFKPRPSKEGSLKWIRQAFFQHRYYSVTNRAGQVESWQFLWSPVNVSLESGDRLQLSFAPQYELLTAPFEIAQGVTLPPGVYRFDRFRAEFESASHRPLQFFTTNWLGTFYDGRLLQQSDTVRHTGRGGHWQTGVTLEQNFARLREGNFVQRLLQVNLTYAWTPNLVLTSFFQYDTESENAGNNLRLRWTVRPGNDLFVVWNRRWERLITDRNDAALVPDRDALTVKLRWTFRK